MIIIRFVNIYSRDLNLLSIFQELMREKHLSKAGAKLGLSQPAMSHALKRLQNEFKDPLFVRAPTGIVPTPLARKIAPRIEMILDEAGSVYRETVKFDPKTAVGRINIATTDYFEQVASPTLIPLLQKLAPNVTVVCRPLAGVLPKEELEKGTYDLAIAGYFYEIPEHFYSQKLYNEHFVCLARKGHPNIKGKLTLKDYVREGHVLITLTGDLKGWADEELEKMKKERRIVIAVSGYFSSGCIVHESDLILTCPSRLSSRLREYLNLIEYEVPLKLPGYTITQVWHNRTHRDPLHQWFRGVLRELCANDPCGEDS